MIPALYLRLAVVLIPTIIAGIAGYKMGTGRWETRYEKLGAEYATYQADVARANTIAERAAREALERQIRERAQIDKSNAETLDAYHTKLAAISADRDRARELARRLLEASQSRAAPRDRGMPETGDRSGATEAGADDRDGLAGRVSRVATECRLNAIQLDALIGQLRPQL